MDPTIIFIVLVLFGGIAAAHLARRQSQRHGKPPPFLVNAVAAAGPLMLCAFCGFGFLTSFEPSENAATFRVIYACFGLLAGGAAIRVGQPMLHR
jgi:hypothetical protein